MAGIPPARDDDAEDVSWALQTAETQWRRNERADALIWLRRATQAAADANDDDRALELARRAAELAEELTAAKVEPQPAPLESLPPMSVSLDDADVAVSMAPMSVDDADVQSLPPSAPPEGRAVVSIPKAPGLPKPIVTSSAARPPSPPATKSLEEPTSPSRFPVPQQFLAQIGSLPDDDEREDTATDLDAHTLAPPAPAAPTPPRATPAESGDTNVSAAGTGTGTGAGTGTRPSVPPRPGPRSPGGPIPGLRTAARPAISTPLGEAPRAVKITRATPPLSNVHPQTERELVDPPTPTPPPTGTSTAPPERATPTPPPAIPPLTNLDRARIEADARLTRTDEADDDDEREPTEVAHRSKLLDDEREAEDTENETKQRKLTRAEAELIAAAEAAERSRLNAALREAEAAPVQPEPRIPGPPRPGPTKISLPRPEPGARPTVKMPRVAAIPAKASQPAPAVLPALKAEPSPTPTEAVAAEPSSGTNERPTAQPVAAEPTTSPPAEAPQSPSFVGKRAEPSTRQVATIEASAAEALLANETNEHPATTERHTPVHASQRDPVVGDEAASAPLDLTEVEAFSDLPEDARETFAKAATVSRLTAGEELADFALAYVITGEVDVSATIVDATASHLHQGGVLRAKGTPRDSVPLRVVCTTPEARVAIWNDDAVEEAFRSCPWVEDDLRALSDQIQTLAGVTMGPLGDRVDSMLRELVTSRLTVRSLLEGEVLVEAGAAVPGLLVVGVGKLELLDKAGAVVREIRSGEFLFPEQVLGAGPAPNAARAGAGGALVMAGDRRTAQELMVTVPPLLEILAGM